MTQPDFPNTGRILDYWLGGKHHFGPDIGAAQAFDAIYPGFADVFKTLRQYIGRAVQLITDEGIEQFLVFGSGIPTQGNVHEVVPGARVLYTDIDRVNVELGQQILSELTHVDYTYCDAADLRTLEPAVVDRVLGPLERVGIVFVGVAAFLDDPTLTQVFDALYDWVPSGSMIAFDFDGTGLSNHTQALDMLAQAGEPLYMRTPETIRPLLGRWELTADGIQSVNTWRNPDAVAPEKPFMYGCVARKP